MLYNTVNSVRNSLWNLLGAASRKWCFGIAPNVRLTISFYLHSTCHSPRASCLLLCHELHGRIKLTYTKSGHGSLPIFCLWSVMHVWDYTDISTVSNASIILQFSRGSTTSISVAWQHYCDSVITTLCLPIWLVIIWIVFRVLVLQTNEVSTQLYT